MNFRMAKSIKAADFVERAPAMAAAEAPLTLTNSVYVRLRDDILRGFLAPETKLRIETMREKYGAGASPVREALNRLSSEGLVSQYDQRGFYVSPVSFLELRELVKTRCWLEALALREAMAAGNLAWEEGILVAMHRLSRAPRYLREAPDATNPEWEDLHRVFHEQLIAPCGSRSLLGFCAELRDQADRYRHLAATISRKRRINVEHEAIVEAILARKADHAVGLLTAHYRHTLEIIEKRSAKDIFGEP